MKQWSEKNGPWHRPTRLRLPPSTFVGQSDVYIPVAAILPVEEQNLFNHDSWNMNEKTDVHRKIVSLLV